MSQHSTGCCTVSLVGCFSVLIVNLRWADSCLFVLGNHRLHVWWKLKFKATVFIAFVIVLLLSYVEFVNTIICCFIWHCILLVLLILPQDPNNRSSAAQTIEDGVMCQPSDNSELQFHCGNKYPRAQHPNINQPTPPSKIPLEEIQQWYTSTATWQHLNAICLFTVKPPVIHNTWTVLITVNMVRPLQ